MEGGALGTWHALHIHYEQQGPFRHDLTDSSHSPLVLALPAIFHLQPPHLRRIPPPPAPNTFVVRYPPVASRSPCRRHAAQSVMAGRGRPVLTPATCLGPERDCSSNAATAGVPTSPIRQPGSYAHTINSPCRVGRLCRTLDYGQARCLPTCSTCLRSRGPSDLVETTNQLCSTVPLGDSHPTCA